MDGLAWRIYGLENGGEHVVDGRDRIFSALDTGHILGAAIGFSIGGEDEAGDDLQTEGDSAWDGKILGVGLSSVAVGIVSSTTLPPMPIASQLIQPRGESIAPKLNFL